MVLPPIIPLPTPSVSGTFGAVPTTTPTPPPFYPPLAQGFPGTGPGLPITPSDGRGLTGLVLWLLGAGATGALALVRARVRAWMIGI